jgi:site-specific recombinase XerC
VSPATIETYSTAVGQLADYLVAHGMPDRATTIRREHIEAFVTDLLEHKAPATAHNRYRGCQAFFNWLVEAGEIKASPMERMKPRSCRRLPHPSCAMQSCAACLQSVRRIEPSRLGPSGHSPRPAL